MAREAVDVLQDLCLRGSDVAMMDDNPDLQVGTMTHAAIRCCEDASKQTKAARTHHRLRSLDGSPICNPLDMTRAPQESIKAARALAGRREGAAEVWERAVLNLLAYGAVGRMDKAHVVRTTEVQLYPSPSPASSPAHQPKPINPPTTHVPTFVRLIKTGLPLVVPLVLLAVQPGQRPLLFRRRPLHRGRPGGQDPAVGRGAL